jgi:hypothetical protein
MGTRNTFFSQFEDLPYFSKELIKVAAQKFEMSDDKLAFYISSSLKKRELISLKRGVYTTAKFYDEHKTDLSYIFYLANRLASPSYISLEAALQYYGILTEAVTVFRTSVTTKLPRKFHNRLGVYSYNNITGIFFGDFKLVKGKFPFLIAKPYKAVFDYLYYKTAQFSAEINADILEEFRLDLAMLSQSDKKLLAKLIKKATKKTINI